MHQISTSALICTDPVHAGKGQAQFTSHTLHAETIDMAACQGAGLAFGIVLLYPSAKE
jgi:hypothetical protein